jgi:hypothetical protein
MKTLNFNDRITYLAWKKEWKAEYAALSQSIRETKPKFKTLQRQIVFAKVNEGKWNEYVVPYFDGKILGYASEHHKVMKEIDNMRLRAWSMLNLLGDAKMKSCKQRLEALPLPSA